MSKATEAQKHRILDVKEPQKNYKAIPEELSAL
jgi:hypothetical protein